MKMRRKNVSPAVWRIESLESRRLLSTTLFVDLAAPGPVHDGSSWADAFMDLQSALSVAKSGMTIEVAQGTYKPTTGTDRTATFQLIDEVSLEGGFAGNIASNPNVRNITGTPSILSGDIGTPGDSSDNSYHVVTGVASYGTATLDGFTITGGNANGTGTNSNDGGGGMLTNSGNTTSSNCIFTGNSGIYGGAMFAGLTSSTITRCTFIDNTVPVQDNGGGGGGAIYDARSLITITDCQFIDNQSAGSGGAIHVFECSPTIDNCTFTGNSAPAGTAIYDETFDGKDYSTSPIITNCIMWRDTGAIANEVTDTSGTSASVTYSDIEGGFSGTGNINADPLFVDPANGDLALQPISPCINAGSNAAVPGSLVDDLTGGPRIVGGVVDMGADEFTGGNIITQHPASAVAGVTLGPIVVELANVAGQVRDKNNSNLSILISSGPAGATFDGTSTVAAQNGVATFSDLRLDVAGTYRLFVIGTLGPATPISLTVSAADPVKLAFVGRPRTITAGAIAPFVVDLLDPFGNVSGNFPGQVRVLLQNNPSLRIIYGYFTDVVGGVATSRYAIDVPAGTYTLIATFREIATPRYYPLTVVPAAATKIVFSQEPTTESAGLPIQPAVTVKLFDAFGNLATNDNSTVTLSVETGPVKVIFGILSVQVVDGQAVFNNVILPTLGTYTLLAEDGSLKAVSTQFTVTPRT